MAQVLTEMTAIDLMYKMAERAKVLANYRIDIIRMQVGTGDTPQQSIADNKHMNRGELIETILIDEFEDEATRIDDEVE